MMMWKAPAGSVTSINYIDWTSEFTQLEGGAGWRFRGIEGRQPWGGGVTRDHSRGAKTRLERGAGDGGAWRVRRGGV